MAHAEAIASIVASQEAASLMEPVARLYFAYFNRTPDYEGFNYYIDERDRGAPIASIADEFAGSLEFEQRYGAVDNASFVDLIHENVFGVPPDPAHRAHWLAQLDSGAMTRGDVMVALSESGAYRAQVGNAVYVAIAFAETLQRAPDAAELAYWERFLEAGNPRRAVIDRLLADTRPK